MIVQNIETQEQAREVAIDWQSSWQDTQYSYGELIEWQDYFTELGKKFNLTDEFKENGII